MSAVAPFAPAPAAVAQPQRKSLIVKLAERYSVEPEKMLVTLKATAFKAAGGVTNEQMMALLIVADQYGLNPWTKEIYAFPDKNNGIVPVVGVDGWLRIINSHPQFDGMEFADSPDMDKAGMPVWIECTIYRKDRGHPTVVREYMAECRRGTGPWQSHPRRMLRHKAAIQCGRLAFGFVGIFDPDEAERMGETVVPESAKAVDDINARLAARSQQPDLMPMRDEVTDATVIESSAPPPSNPEPKQDIAAAADEQTPAPPEVVRGDPATPDVPVHTHAQVTELLNKARNIDELDTAATAIETVSSLAQRKELAGIYRKMRAALESQS